MKFSELLKIANEYWGISELEVVKQDDIAIKIVKNQISQIELEITKLEQIN